MEDLGVSTNAEQVLSPQRHQLTNHVDSLRGLRYHILITGYTDM